jgi:sugar transferase (PEP-CTERM system associated)
MFISWSFRVSASRFLEFFLEGGVFFLAMLASYVIAVKRTGVYVFPPDVFLYSTLFSLSLVAVNWGLGFYRRGRTRRFPGVILRAGLTFLIGTPVAYFVLNLLPHGRPYEGVMLVALGLSVVGVIALHGLFSLDRSASVLKHRILVVGAGEEAWQVKRSLDSLSPRIAEVIGFYPVKSDDVSASAGPLLLDANIPLEDWVSRLNVHEVIVAAREQRGGSLPITDLLNCRLRGVFVSELSSFYERLSGEVPIDTLKASWLVYSEGFRQNWGRNFVKRLFDIAVASLLLLLTAPVILITSIAILLEGRGPVFFTQDRVGRGGKIFKVFKFRSMRADAEGDGTPRWAQRKDSRTTFVGRFIRPARIDELPQLFNVLKGDMSFVGPRPERPYFVDQLNEEIPFYAARHTIKPGLTGWAQIRYAYAGSFEDSRKKLQFDLYYIKNHTLLLDFVILFETVRVVLLGEGAR